MNLRSTAPLVVCPPTSDPVMMALTMTEETAHRAGWDAPVALHILHRLKTDNQRIAVTAPSHYGVLHPLVLLTRMLEVVEEVDSAVLAFILVVEQEVTYALGSDVATVGEAAPLHTNRARSAFLAALEGRDIHLIRYRGEEPEEQHVCPAHGPDPIALMLRRVADKAAGVLAAKGH